MTAKAHVRSGEGRFWCAFVLAFGWGGALLPGNEFVYERDIRPIFREHCFDCHGAQGEPQGGLDLRLVRFQTSGGVSGPALVPGQPESSYLLDRIRAGEMPPGKSRLHRDEVDRIEQWIASGAPTSRPEPESLPPGLGITPEERSFWSFRPIACPPAPPVQDPPTRVADTSPLDAFIVSRLPEGWSQSPEASREVLVRRAYLDLLGLPPSLDEVQRWTAEPSPSWFEQLVDSLLASPHYGEQWGRHWLDIAGYADSEGYNEADADRPWAWKYRDWVIRAFNEDKPYDQFLHEQLAGDELAGPVQGDLTEQQIVLLTATGFLRMAADGTGSGSDTPEARHQVVTDTLKILGTTLFGLSIQCAQCHDHRYDPIPQTDYYSLRAIFEPALDCNAWKHPSERMLSLYKQADREAAQRIEMEAQLVATQKEARQEQLIQEQLEKQLLRVADESLRAPLREAYRTAPDKRTTEQNTLLESYPFVRQLSPGSLYLYDAKNAEELKDFDQRVQAIRQRKPTEEFIRVLLEPPNHQPETHLFYRGDFQQPKQVVAPGLLTISVPENEPCDIPIDNPALPTTGRRLAFARSLTRLDHPLVARVIVNRVWMHHFGRGIVTTPAEFGKLGTRPTHPELLDWLAVRFVRGGWSIKKLHRLILTSHTWRQENGQDIDLQRAGMANEFYARKPLQRLAAETVRDRILVASGQLQGALYGSPTPIHEDETGQVMAKGPHRRRSIYLEMRRSRPIAVLQTFDAPVMQTNCEMRANSTSASQSLMLLNGEFILEQAGLVADRVAREAHNCDRSELPRLATELSVPCDERLHQLAEQVDKAWELCLIRTPQPEERLVALRFLLTQQAEMRSHNEHLPAGRTPEQQSLTNLCQMLLSCNEFLYGE